MTTQPFGDERGELHRLFVEAWASSTSQAGRNAYLTKGVRDAVQAHRPWAVAASEQAITNGLADMLKRWAKRERMSVKTRTGKRFDTPRVAGALETDSEGGEHWTQLELDGMTVEQLRDKRKRDLSQIRSYRNSVATVDKLIALCEAAEESTPRAAARKLGTTVENWLAA